MNIFKSLIGKVWQDPNAAEVVKISTGQLYLIRPENIRSSRECIYNEAMATIRRVPSVEHHFQLVITRVYEDGDQELLEDEEETDEERVFLIGEEIEFRVSETDGEPTLVWRDLDGDIDECYEFVAAGSNAPTLAFFETCMYRAMYERKHKTSAQNTRDGDLEEFIWRPPVKKTKGKATARRKASSKDEPDAGGLTEAMGSLSVATSSSKKETRGNPSTSPSASPTRLQVSSASSLSVLASYDADLYEWKSDAGQFNHQASVVAQVVSVAGEGFKYFLIASSEEGRILAHLVSSDMNQKWTSKMLSLTWNYTDGGHTSSWVFKFHTEEAFEAFRGSFIIALWETLHQAPWEKVKLDERSYVTRSFEDVEMADVQDDEDEEDAVASELDPEEEISDEESEVEEGTNRRHPELTGNDRNSQLTVGYKGDRSYVVRGNKIGVFNHSLDNDVDFYGSIAGIATTKGKAFNPKHIMLHDQDTKMILMNPLEPNSLFSMDIERGKVVEEWKVHDSVAVNAIAPENKFAQTTPEQTIVGTSHNALFRIDPRVSGSKLVDSQFKQYVSKNKFSGVTTTASGKVAVASEKGEIRLFDTIGKNAKTALPPLGDPILGIDVTADGRWIVATTKTYLLLIDTKIGEGRYAGSLGFDRSFPATAKPMPRRLQLRGEHVAYMEHNVSFTPARFNQGVNQEENAIVTSTGQFVVAWDFAKVKKGQLDKYEIKKYEDFVVQDNFKFGDDKEMSIVALQNDVIAINKKNLKKPTRASLAPSRNSRSKSHIVNSPY